VESVENIPVGVIIERREVDHPWADHRWLPVAVVPGAQPTDDWRFVSSGDRWERYHAATVPVELHRKETEAYRVNLSDERPSVYVVLRTDDDPDAEREIAVHCATVSPYEAQDYLDSGEDIVERVEMPDGMVAWVQAFIDRHHVDEPFKKRKRQKHKLEEQRFGKVLHPIEQRFWERKRSS